MAMESTLILRALSTRDTGNMINNMERESRSGKMAPSIKVNTLIITSTVMENILTHRGRYLKGAGRMDCDMAGVN